MRIQSLLLVGSGVVETYLKRSNLEPRLQVLQDRHRKVVFLQLTEEPACQTRSYAFCTSNRHRVTEEPILRIGFNNIISLDYSVIDSD